MSASITVRFVGSLRNAIGKSKVTFNIEEAKTLKELVEAIVKKFPEAKRLLIDPELGDPRPNTLIIVNDREVSVLGGLETILQDGDKVVFVPVSHGG
ncbi:MAG: MoaD/ThiS family protein [Candidatus Bathyarchaeia archaeon]